MSFFTPTVFIGVGGAGKNILLRIRRLIVENHKMLENLPSVRFLHVDTDERLEPDAGVNIPLEVLGQSLQFKDAERCVLQRINDEIRQSGQSIKTNLSVKDWFDATLPLDSNFSTGAGGIRPYGRLAFHYSVDIFRQRVSSCIAAANDQTNVQKTSDILSMSPGTNLEVYVICSLLGGTGSGTFLEVCYNTLAAVKGKMADPYLTGVFIISGADVDERRRANCYSALMELEYHSTASITGKPSPHFDIHYPLPDVKPIHESRAPVDLCYLVSHMGEGNYTLSRNQMEEAIALNLFMEFGSVISEEKKSRRKDFAGIEEFRRLDDELLRSRQFISFGISTLEFPAPRVQDMMAHELAAVSLKGWLFTEKKESPDLERDRRDIEAVLEENNLIQSLLSIDNKHLIQRIGSKLADHEVEVKKLIDQDNTDPELIIATAKSNIDSNIEDMNFSMDPKKCGIYARQIADKADDKQEEISQIIIRKVHDLVESEHRGPREAKAYLSSLAQLLGTLGTRFEKQHISLQNAAARAQTTLNDSGLKKLRESLGQESFALHHHNKRIHSEFLLTYMNLSAKREAYRAAKGALLVDRMEDGVKIASLVTLVDDLLKEVDFYTDSLNQLSNRLNAKAEDIEKTIINTPIAEGITLNTIRLREIAKSKVPSHLPHVTPLLRHVKDAFSEKDKEGKIIREARILTLVNRRRDEMESSLLQRCSEICESVKKISVASEIKDKPKLRDILSQKIRYSKPMIQGAGFKAGENIRLHWLATANPQEDMDLKSVCDTIDTIYQYRGSHTDRHLPNLPDPYRIIFASEKGIFPLQRITILHEYRRDYQMIQSKHTDIRKNYPDILPTTEEDAIRKQAERAALMGKFFGFLSQKPDPKTGYEYIFLSCYDDVSCTYEHYQVAENWDKVKESLSLLQINKQIYHKEGGTTHLEKLEQLIEGKGFSPKTKMEKEVLWRMLQKYLDELMTQLEGGDINPEFQRQRDIIQEFRQTYGIHPPVGDHRREVAQDSPVVPPPPMDTVGKFRQVIEDYLKKDILDKNKLIKYGVFMFKLSKEDAASIFDEVTRGRGTLEQRLQSYRDGFEAVILNGEITAEERSILKQNQSELGLTDEQVRQIEGPHTRSIYLDYFKLAVIDNKIESFERARLRGLQEALNLSNDVVKEIESDYSFEEE
jgi:hypothetical protein